MRSAEEIASLMATASLSPQAQIRQTRFRQTLAQAWGIKPGDRLLEIGCGQGDMTAVLADVVGPAGHVTAVDIASRDYGAPITVGKATDHLKRGLLGANIDFHFEFDALNAQFENDAFDGVVLALSTWYFADLESLKAMLTTVSRWAPRLHLAEWDLAPISTEQWAHFLAVMIQGQIEAFKMSSEANVRTPYSRQSLQNLLAEAGWQVAQQETVDAGDLDDGRWEVEGCLRQSPDDVEAINAPEKAKAFLRSQLDLLRTYADGREILSLPAYAITAERQ